VNSVQNSGEVEGNHRVDGSEGGPNVGRQTGDCAERIRSSHEEKSKRNGTDLFSKILGGKSEN